LNRRGNNVLDPVANKCKPTAEVQRLSRRTVSPTIAKGQESWPRETTN
jgi:hypothetical protein